MALLSDIYERLVGYASQHELAQQLQFARQEYVARTGDLFETDPSFERRMVALFEWYVLDRALPDGTTPLEHYAQHQHEQLSDEEQQLLGQWQAGRLSLFEIRKKRGGAVNLVDQFTGDTLPLGDIHAVVGLAHKDLLIARALHTDGGITLTDGITVIPKGGQRFALRHGRSFRQAPGTRDERCALLHRLTYLVNRCDRYKHVDPKLIFTG